MESSSSASYKSTNQHSRHDPIGDLVMRNEARKLTMFSTRNMRPLLTTDDLDPVMAKLGFGSTLTHPPPASSSVCEKTFSGWREYVFNGKWARVKSLEEPPPLVLLPFPRIDGLHESIYADFIKAVEFYLRRDNVTEILHVRGMPLDRFLDRGKAWRSMEDVEILVFVYREVPMLEVQNHAVRSLENGADIEKIPGRQSSRISPRLSCEGGHPEARRVVDFSDIVNQ